jgi:hypothetical protein
MWSKAGKMGVSSEAGKKLKEGRQYLVVEVRRSKR